jgi:uncharacterized lipoprotein YddW (UPF0748 family)
VKLRSLLLAPLLLGSLINLPLNAQPTTPQRIGVWLTNRPSDLYYSADRLTQAVKDLRGAGFNTVYPNVWSRGQALFRSQVAPMEPDLAQANLPADPSCILSREGRSQGLQVVPWFEYGLMQMPGSAIVRQNPDWVLRRQNGSSRDAPHGVPIVWLNPAHPGVQQYILTLVREVATACPIDGVQFDDHFVWPVAMGYDRFTRQLYRRETGFAPPADINNRYWRRWRQQKLTNLLAQIRLEVKATNPNAIISLAPGPYRQAYNRYLQNWDLWADSGLVDEVILQNYHSGRASFLAEFNHFTMRGIRPNIPVNVGLLAGFGRRSNSLPELDFQLQEVRRRGFGVVYFYYEGLWGDRYRLPEPQEVRRQGIADLHRHWLGDS